MRGTAAKRLRRAVYGDLVTKSSARRYERTNAGPIEAESRRRVYQRVKRAWRDKSVPREEILRIAKTKE
jgi:hypothetical protein